MSNQYFTQTKLFEDRPVGFETNDAYLKQYAYVLQPTDTQEYRMLTELGYGGLAVLV